MEPFFVGLVIGAVVSAGVTLLGIFMNYEVRDREWWEKQEQEMAALRSGLNKLVAENSELRVAFAAADWTEDAKKVAAMTMAVLEANIETEKTT